MCQQPQMLGMEGRALPIPRRPLPTREHCGNTALPTRGIPPRLYLYRGPRTSKAGVHVLIWDVGCGALAKRENREQARSYAGCE